MAQEFKRGDVVYLKSGSDAMTVSGYDTVPDGLKIKESEDTLTCCWQIKKTKDIVSRSFHQDLLTKEDPNHISFGGFGLD